MISVLPVGQEQEKEDRNRKYLQNQVGVYQLIIESCADMVHINGDISGF